MAKLFIVTVKPTAVEKTVSVVADDVEQAKSKVVLEVGEEVVNVEEKGEVVV